MRPAPGYGFAKKPAPVLTDGTGYNSKNDIEEIIFDKKAFKNSPDITSGLFFMDKL